MKQYIILVDSATGYDEEQAKEHNLAFVPLMISVNNKTIADNNKEITIDKFYKILETEPIKTSQTPPGILKKKLDELLQKYEQILFFPISSHLSGQYQSAILLAQDNAYKNKVYIIDSEAVGDINKEMINRAKLFLQERPINELQGFIDEQKTKYCAFILPYQLDTLVRGGRISSSAAALANLLKIKPILEFNGFIDKFDKTRTFKKAIKEVLKEIKKRYDSSGELTIMHSLCDIELKEEVIKIITKEKFTIKHMSLISNVIAAHTGYNTFVLVYWIK
ncbi:DegV family protein [Spiroplasma endosymbiont of Asaphidion curtum]|uniref:DegV family protein n=1 Tax=Spiroplasma endosymbiont of Asaphidion curtum TaxID=3066281 RepID=UPI00313C4E64